MAAMRTFNAGLEQVDTASLKLVDGYAGTIVNRIVDHLNNEWTTTVADAEATRNKAREITKPKWEEAKVRLGSVLGLLGVATILALNALSFLKEPILRRGLKKRQRIKGKWKLVINLSMK
jgi:hypothetical protein